MKVTMKLISSENLRKEIANNGYSIRQFSQYIKVSSPYLSLIINEKQNPSPHTAWKIAKGLGLDINDIFFAVSDDKSETKRNEITSIPAS